MKNINLNNKKILAITGEFVKTKRKQLNYCHDGVAKAVNISQPIVSKIEHGIHSGLKYTMLHNILDYLKTNMAELDEYIKQKNANDNLVAE
ncbi:MAG: helix-turn-helix domain-containing protein [Bacteroidetes bacterium]|nr:helix-turn-helix domain-containing protein [Bacteroidota bacterium]